jgi:hypothetical protein
VAEDWNQAFGLAGGGHSVGAQDLAGVALAAAQELDRRGTTLQAQLEARTAQVPGAAGTRGRPGYGC